MWRARQTAELRYKSWTGKELSTMTLPAFSAQVIKWRFSFQMCGAWADNQMWKMSSRLSLVTFLNFRLQYQGSIGIEFSRWEERLKCDWMGVELCINEAFYMKFRIFSVLKETLFTIDNFPVPCKISFQTSDSMFAINIDEFDMYLKYLPPAYHFFQILYTIYEHIKIKQKLVRPVQVNLDFICTFELVHYVVSNSWHTGKHQQLLTEFCRPLLNLGNLSKIPQTQSTALRTMVVISSFSQKWNYNMGKILASTRKKDS